MRQVQVPVTDEVILGLKVGDSVSLSGRLVTGRDAAHKWLWDNFIKHIRQPPPEDVAVFEAIKPLLDGSMIYHCGPVVDHPAKGGYKFLAAGPTTSMREESYEADVMHLFNIKGVIGKGGMGPKTLKACQEVPAVYLHAIGGAASYLAQRVTHVYGVYKLELGSPEAIWVIEVKDFPAVVTMDAHGSSLHARIEQKSKKILDELIA